MPKTAHSTLSDEYGRLTAEGVLMLTCPRSWKEMTQGQLRYALHVIGSGLHSPEENRTLMLIRFTGIEVLKKTPGGWACAVHVSGRKRRHFFFLQVWQVQEFIKQLEYVDSFETMDVRLESVQGFKAVDAMLHGVRFHDYLQMEKYYQGYLATKEEHYAIGLAQLLYPGGVTAIDNAEMTGCIMWYSYVKKQFASRYFRHFFRPAPEAKTVDWLEQMNAQIRALTDGDITKEQAVYEKDCWRALTELDAKAREAEEFRRKYPND